MVSKRLAVFVVCALVISGVWYSARFFDRDLRTSLPSCGTEFSQTFLGVTDINCDNGKFLFQCEWDFGYYLCQTYSSAWMDSGS